MQRNVLIVVLAICGLGSITLGEDGKKDDISQFQGKWAAVAYTEDGEVAARLEKTPIDWEFQKDRLTITAHDQQVFTLKGSFKLDEKAQPRNVDLKIDKHDDIPEQIMKGIYRIEKDKLTICYAPEGKRPTAFESKQDSREVLIVFEKK